MQMSVELAQVAAVLFAVVVGVLLGRSISRCHASALAQTAAAEARAAMQVELATLTERQASTAAALQSEREQHQALRQESGAWRHSLDEASNQIAALTERAGRVPVLEVEVKALEAALEERAAELRRLSTVNGENSAKATQLAQQLVESLSQGNELQQRLDAASGALQQANEARAALDQQARRVPDLEQQLCHTRGLLGTFKDQLAEVREAAGKEAGKLMAELLAEREALDRARRELDRLKGINDALNAKVSEMTAELTELRTRSEQDRQHSEEKLQLLVDAKNALSDQFRSLAGDILEEKSKRFSEQNQASLGQLLEPLRAQLTEFKGKVEEVYHQEGKDRSALAQQVKQLVDLNQTLSQDAKNLTQALKGQAKTQGNWGELILERVLEASGLRKGHEYKVQDSKTLADGSRLQPDVVIELPEDRKLIVDAKVSLVAYDRYVSAETDEARSAAMKQHLASVRAHIKGLSDKRYHELYGMQSPDFVLAFVPVEPAFMLAVTNDSELFMDAWNRSVLLVSPSTLLFVVRTVAHLWKQEFQSRNAQDIAKRGAELYDKLCGFVTDLQKVGERLDQAKVAYDDAHSKLTTGRGNAIRQAELLKKLGVRPGKALPAALVQDAGVDDEGIVVPTLAALTAPATMAASESAEQLPSR
jgi:DNA recombination protein RmuC